MEQLVSGGRNIVRIDGHGNTVIQIDGHNNTVTLESPSGQLVLTRRHLLRGSAQRS